MAANTVFKKTYLALWSAVLVSGIGLSGCWNSQSPQDLLKEAQNYHAKGDDPAAIIQLKNALQKDANYGDARYLLGTLYKETGNLAAAEDELHRALLSGVNKEKVQGDLGQVYLSRGEFQKVIDEIKPDSASKPEVQASILVLRGDAFIGLGNREDAAASFEEAQKTDPAYLGAILGQARLQAAEGKLDAALNLVGQVITKDPRNVDAWIMKGDMYRATDKTDAAADAYKQAAAIDSKNPQAHANLAALYVTTGQMDLAQTEIATFEKLYPNSLMGKYLQALLSFRAQKFTVARDDIAQVLKVAPDHMPSVLLDGVTAYQLGSMETAQKELGRFVEAFPQNAYSRKMLALVDLKQKQPVEALKALAPLMGVAHPEPQVVTLAAEAYSLTGEYSKAAQMLEKEATKDPENATLRTQLGLTRLASGQTGRAIADLESAAKMDPAHMEAENALAMTYLGKKDYDQALLYAQRMVKKDPKNPAYRNLVGAAYVGKNDLVNARKSFEAALATDSSYVPAELNLAQIDLKQNKVPEASKRFEDILTKDKNNLQAMMFLAGIAKSTGDDSKAIDWLQKAAKANPKVLQPRADLVRYYLQKKQNKEAVDQAKEAVAADANDTNALDLLGSTQLAAGQSKDAVATYTKLVQLVPRAPVAYYRLGNAQVMAQDDAGAAVSFGKALQFQSDYQDALNALVALDLRAGNYAEAAKLAHDYQVRFPKSPEGFVLEGDIAAAQKDYVKAANAYGHAQTVAKTTAAEIKLHSVLSLSGKAAQADNLMLQWLKAYPNDLLARTYLASAFLKEGNSKSAMEQYQILLQKAPDDALALNNLAWIYHEAKDGRALETARHANRVAPGNPQVMDTLGWILVSGGESKEGLDLLQKASTLAPSDLDIRYHYGSALALTGDKAKARQVLKEIVDSGKDFTQLKQAKALLSQL